MAANLFLLYLTIKDDSRVWNTIHRSTYAMVSKRRTIPAKKTWSKIIALPDGSTRAENWVSLFLFAKWHTALPASWWFQFFVNNVDAYVSHGSPFFFSHPLLWVFQPLEIMSSLNQGCDHLTIPSTWRPSETSTRLSKMMLQRKLGPKIHFIHNMTMLRLIVTIQCIRKCSRMQSSNIE